MFTGLLILTKRQLKSVVFILLLIFMPILYVWFSEVKAEDEEVIVLLSLRDKDEVSVSIVEDLLKARKGYTFKLCEEDEIYEAVRSGKAESGYIFSEKLSERIADGTRKGNIILVERRGSILTDAVNEIVFGAYFKYYARVYTSATFGNEETRNDFLDRYDTYYNKYVDDVIIMERIPIIDEDEKLLVFSMRNLYAIVLMLLTLVSVVQFCYDRKKGLLSSMRRDKLVKYRFIYPVVETLPVAFCILAGIFIKAGCKGIVRECIAMLAYVLVLSVFGALLSYIGDRYMIILGIIPIVFIINVIVCPVFVDITMYSPVVSVFRWMCLPYYYMIMF